MMIYCFTIFIITFAVLSSLIIADDPCRFVSPSKGVIDLTSLARTDGEAAYPDTTPSPGSGYKYSYNPCKPFSTADVVCKNVSVCQASTDEQFSYALGTQDSARWNEGAGSEERPSVSYSLDIRQVNVELVCSNDGTNLFEVLGESPLNLYRFRLTNKCACWDGCGVTPPPQKNCSIDGYLYTSDKEVLQSFPFHVSINPNRPTPTYAMIDTDSRVTRLTLSNIASIPPALFCLAQLEELSILNSADVLISPEISRLASSLTSLTLSKISQSLVLPPQVFDLTLLSTLSIVNCGLETLSDDIIRLERLTQLILDQNKLVALPLSLRRMPSLTTLSVNGNAGLSSLDALSESTSLEILRGSNCIIDHLPPNINNLHTIEMNGNQLTSLDGIETVTSVVCDEFLFANNKIASISANALEKIRTLLYLDLSGNLLTELPESVYRIDDLETLNIRNNKFDAREKEWIRGLFEPTNTTLLI